MVGGSKTGQIGRLNDGREKVICMKCRPFHLKQVKWSTTNEEGRKTGQIGG